MRPPPRAPDPRPKNGKILKDPVEGELKKQIEFSKFRVLIDEISLLIYEFVFIKHMIISDLLVA